MATAPVPHAAGRHWDVSQVNFTYPSGLVPEACVGNSREMKAAAGAVRAGRGDGRRGPSRGKFIRDSGSTPLEIHLGFREHSFGKPSGIQGPLPWKFIWDSGSTPLEIRLGFWEHSFHFYLSLIK